jgi:hypothetical protein
MVHCEHCESLAVEVRETRASLEKLIVEITTSHTILEGMQKTLLGNGQPGKCALHGERIARLERWRSWLAGALAVIGLLWGGTVTVLAAVLAERMKK